jgi:hypothetical protein
MERHPHIPHAAKQRTTLAPDARQAQRARRWGVMALLALVVLLTSLMSQPQETSWGGPGVRLMPQLPAPLVYSLGGLFVLIAVATLAVLFPYDRLFRRRKKSEEFQLYYEPPKPSFGVYVVLGLALLLPIGFAVWLYLSGGPPLSPAQGQPQVTPSAQITPQPPKAAPEKPAVTAPGFAWTLLILASLAGLGILASAAWLLCGTRFTRWWYGMSYAEEARQALRNAVEIGLDDLLREPDPRRAVVVCYRRLEQVLEQHGLPRMPWQTPVEYVHVALQRFHLPAARLQGLTTLFELAKFSAHALGEREKQTAVEALRTVKTTLNRAILHWHTDVRAQAPVTACSASRVDESSVV